MAIRAGRVGVRPDQVDPYGRLKATDWLIEQLRDMLNSNEAEIHAYQLARLEIERLELDKEIVQKPIEPIEPIITPVDEIQTEEPVVKATVKKTMRKKAST